jgi:hypothetical protein
LGTFFKVARNYIQKELKIWLENFLIKKIHQLMI